MGKYITAIVLVFCSACTQNTIKLKPVLSTVLSQIIADSSIVASSYLDINVVSGEEVHNKIIKTPNWNNVLNPFLNLKIPNLNTAEKVLDSFRNLKIETYYFPKSEKIETVAINTLNNKIQLIEIVQNLNNTWSLQKITYSYQPTKGYAIKTQQKYVWTKPNTTILLATYSAI